MFDILYDKLGKRIGQNKCINIPFDPEDKHHQYIDFIKFIKQYAKMALS